DAFDSAGEALSDVAGFCRATSVAALGAESDVVVLMLPSSDVVADVLFGGGLVDAMRDGTSIVDMGSSRPHETQKNAGVVARRRIEYVDAPVSGGVSAAIQGTLTIMVGGQEAVLDRFGTLLGSLGTNVVHAGP